VIRSFRIDYTVLALNFLLPALYYCVDADGAAQMFASLGAWFGVTDYPWTENSMFWRILGIGNVATLGFCCVLLLLDLVKYYPVLVPLVFLKSCSVLGFVLAGISSGHPSFLVGVLFDGVTVALMVFFARAAHREMLV